MNLILPGRNYGWPYVAGYRDDRTYVFANWSHPTGVPCRSLKFSEYDIPPSVPTQKESEWKGEFQPPLRTFFTAPAGYNPRTDGSSTIAPSSLGIYTGHANGIPGWANSLLLPGMTRGRVYRMKLSDDGRSVVGENEELFRTANRYRDLAIAPDGLRFYLVTDPLGIGRTTDPAGASTQAFANPGAVVEFTYQAGR